MRPGPDRGAEEADNNTAAEEAEEAGKKVDGRAPEAVSRCPCCLAGSIWVRRPLPTFPSGPGVPRRPPSAT
jgi:hypothetical protein